MIFAVFAFALAQVEATPAGRFIESNCREPQFCVLEESWSEVCCASAALGTGTPELDKLGILFYGLPTPPRQH